MLTSGDTICLMANKINVQNGLFAAPRININGILLDASYPINKKIAEFIFSKTGKIAGHINRVAIAQELFVRIKGNFNLSLEETKSFAKKYSRVINLAQKKLKPLEITTPIFKKKLAKNIKLRCKFNTIAYQTIHQWCTNS